MKFSIYLSNLSKRSKLSSAKEKMLRKLWGDDLDSFPKPWVSSKELSELTDQPEFARRLRECREELGCDLETEYLEHLGSHGWRLNSEHLGEPKVREYLTEIKKRDLFSSYENRCSVCGVESSGGIRGLHADHKVPISRGGKNDLDNWQPLCHECNVGKRRACQGCSQECKSCSWAYPDSLGLNTLVKFPESLLRELEKHCDSSGKHLGEVVCEAAEEYLKKKNK